MNDPMTLAGALNALELGNDAQWTKTGLPKIGVLRQLTGDDDLKQSEVNALLPDGYNRTNAGAAPSFIDPPSEGKPVDEQIAEVEDKSILADLAALEGEVLPEAADTGSESGAVEALEKAQDAFEGDEDRVTEANPILLLEAAVAAGSTDRYRRNSALQGVLRAYQVSQDAIREHQSRLDYRIEERVKANAEANAKEEAGE